VELTQVLPLPTQALLALQERLLLIVRRCNPSDFHACRNATTNGYLTSTDWTTFNNKGSGTVSSVSALTLGTTGTDLSSTVANSTTTPVITLNVPTASATNRGALSSADWTTFNGELTNPMTTLGDIIMGHQAVQPPD